MIPKNIQEKIDSYTSILLDRFSPSSSYFKLSSGYTKSSDAIADTTPLSSVFTSDDLQPDIGNFLFTNLSKDKGFNGGNLWYHVFSSSGSDLIYVILVESSGRVTNKLTY
jgi:hypothetical protein